MVAPINSLPLSANDLDWLENLLVLDPVQQAILLSERQVSAAALIPLLAETALQNAENDVASAMRWLAVAEGLLDASTPDPALAAPIAYAQARLHLVQGRTNQAELALRQAEQEWQSAADTANALRTLTGLTQVLAVQGRYAEAEVVALRAIDGWETLLAQADNHAVQVDVTLRLTHACHNFATLLVYQERHNEALIQYDHILQLCALLTTLAPTDETVAATLAAEIQEQQAHTHLNRASVFIGLDRLGEAEENLGQALTLFAQLGLTEDQGRTQSNLATLFLRTGRYADSLGAFDQAAHALIPQWADQPSLRLVPDVEQLRPADMLLLNQAMAYLALNLLDEAEQSLGLCERLFRISQQPNELAQTLFTLGNVASQRGNDEAASSALAEANTLFASLQNRFWQNRCEVALATVQVRQGDMSAAGQRLDLLLSAVGQETDAGLAWNRISLSEAKLLRIRIHLMAGEVEAAEASADEVANLLGIAVADTPGQSGLWPQLAVRLYRERGRIAVARNDPELAQQYLWAAIILLEQQRTSLPVEEIRTSFLDDKTEIYNYLVSILLTTTATLPSEDSQARIAEAFAVIERARSRVLLERLFSVLPEATTEDAQATAIRQRLHWLYNQLLSNPTTETQSPTPANPPSETRHTAALQQNLAEQLQAQEAILQVFEWRTLPITAQAQPVDLAEFQGVLAHDQQAVVYAMIEDELLAFVIQRQQVQVLRQLCSVPQLEAALAEWRFQLGRAEMDSDYRTRHAERMLRTIRASLQQLYQLVFAPIAQCLANHCPQLLIVTSGPLHALPIHALWDGQRYLIERFQCSYAPSASFYVYQHRQLQTVPRPSQSLSFAGFALPDPAIPAARQEVEAAAQHFSKQRLWLDEAANRLGLWQAAAEADVLHLATHALFRPDNPFFSVLKLADGWVDVRELYRLPLVARLVVLSACESGAGQLRAGEEVIGLARGFLVAGACELIASLWNVHDSSAATLMNAFYQQLGQQNERSSVATALSAAQRTAAQAGQHPYFWAGFYLIGG